MCKTVQKSRTNDQGKDGFLLSLVPEFTAPPVVRHRSTPSPCATGRAAAAALLQLISAAANFRTRFRKVAVADCGKFSESSFAPRLPLLPYPPTCGTQESEATHDAAKSILQTTQLALARFWSSSLPPFKLHWRTAAPAHYFPESMLLSARASALACDPPRTRHASAPGRVPRTESPQECTPSSRSRTPDAPPSSSAPTRTPAAIPYTTGASQSGTPRACGIPAPYMPASANTPTPGSFQTNQNGRSKTSWPAPSATQLRTARSRPVVRRCSLHSRSLPPSAPTSRTTRSKPRWKTTRTRFAPPPPVQSASTKPSIPAAPS